MWSRSLLLEIWMRAALHPPLQEEEKKPQYVKSQVWWNKSNSHPSSPPAVSSCLPATLRTSRLFAKQQESSLFLLQPPISTLCVNLQFYVGAVNITGFCPVETTWTRIALLNDFFPRVKTTGGFIHSQKTSYFILLQEKYILQVSVSST